MTKRYIKRKLQDILLSICALAIWAAVVAMMITAWVGHPAEQPVNGHTYLEMIGGEIG